MSYDEVDETASVLWRAASRYHDWYAGDRVARIAALAREAGIIGTPTWAQRGLHGDERPVTGVADAAELLRPQAGGKGIVLAACGGRDPHPWRMEVMLLPYNPEWRRVDGYNMVGVHFPRSGFEDAAGSGRILEAFRAAHSPDDTEFAAVHPLAAWERLRSAAYSPPLTVDPMFAGVFWLDFLGPGHLDDFDLERLRDLEAHRVEWLGERGLRLQALPTLAEADTPAGEAELLRLTERFRAALRP